MNVRKSAGNFLDARRARKVIRDRRAGSMKRYAIGSVLVLIAILIASNLLVDVLARDLKIDFTSTGLHTLSEDTKQVLTTLDREVEIIGLFEKPATLQGSNYQPFIPLIDEYKSSSSGKIKVTYVDPKQSPSFVAGIDPTGQTQFTEGNFVIRSGDRFLEINPFSCIIFDKDEYTQNNRYVAIGNRIEAVFTGAISYLSANDLRQIYFLKGHGESENAMISSLLQYDGYESHDLYLDKAGSVPEDCDLIVLNLPGSDITEKESVILSDYLISGGRVIVASDFPGSSIPLIRVEALVRSMGISMTTDLILEYSPDYLYDVKINDFSKARISPEYAEAFDMFYVSVGQARNIKILDQVTSGIKIRPMLISSPYSTVNPMGVIDDRKVSQGVYNYVVIAQREDEKAGQMAVLGTGYLSADGFLSGITNAEENARFFRNLVRSMNGQEFASPIPPKEIPGYGFANLPSVTMQTTWSVVLIALLPFIFISMGIIVYYQRRHR